MEKLTTTLSAHDRVILFCVATATDCSTVGITAHAMQSMAIRGFIAHDRESGAYTLTDSGRATLTAIVEHRNVGIDYSWAEGRFVDPLTRLETGRHARSLQEFGSYRVKRAAWRPP